MTNLKNTLNKDRIARHEMFELRKIGPSFDYLTLSSNLWVTGNELVHLKIKKNILNMIKWNSKEEVCQLSVQFLKKKNW